jgi:hypothetical protein
MAVTFTDDYMGVVGARKVWRGTVTFDTSYPTGGESVSVGDLGFSVEIESLHIVSNDEAGISASWDATNSKIKLFDEDGTSGIEAEFASTGDASANIVSIEAFGF